MRLGHRHIMRRVVAFAILLLSIIMTSSCITDSIDECPTICHATFRFDMNIHASDAFSGQVSDVTLFAFDHTTGALSFSGTSTSNRMTLDVGPGVYDITVWGGTLDNRSFSSPSTAPSSITGSFIRIPVDTSATLLTPVFHGAARFIVTDNNLTGSMAPQVIDIPLVKDTNRVNITLVSPDGSPLAETDFSMQITCNNAIIAHDNSVSDRVVYRPWAVRVSDEYLSRTVTRLPVHISEFSLGRLMADAHSRLEIFRTSDGMRIVDIPLEDNLLLYRNKFHAAMDAQEYLDRLDSFDISFIVNSDREWNPLTNIFINNWATPPVQYIDW